MSQSMQKAKTSSCERPSSASKYIARLVYDNTGISLYEGESSLIRTRLSHRIKELDLGSLEAYCTYLKSGKVTCELACIIDSLSSDLTFFFRDEGQLQFMVDECLPRVVDGVTQLNIWSIPCSSGEEAYTLGIFLSENKGSIPAGLDWRIYASDLSSKAIGEANRAIYSADDLKNVPMQLRDKYFESCSTDGSYKVRRVLSEKIQFKRANLFDEHNFENPFHIIACRNLMIYFDWQQQKTLVQWLSRYLERGGYLLLGDLESLTGLTVPFHCVGHRVYQKTSEEPTSCFVRDKAFRVHSENMNYRLLVIDEKEPLLDVVFSFLTTLGYSVNTASNDSEAHRLFRVYSFDLMIVDLSFFYQYGVGHLSRFNEGRSNAPVIVLTNMGYDEHLLNHLLENGATMSMSKTLPLEQLAQSVSSCLAKHS